MGDLGYHPSGPSHALTHSLTSPRNSLAPNLLGRPRLDRRAVPYVRAVQAV